MSFTRHGGERRDMARQYECCVTTYYHLYINGCSLRSTRTAQFFHFFSRTRLNFKKSGKLKRLKSSYSLSLCLLEALKVRHLRDQPLTDKQTGRQTDRQTDRETDRETDRQRDRQTDRQTDRETDRQRQSDY